MFVPKSIVCIREGITREQLLRDLMAGVVVGVVALPLALAFAIASGVPPERGLYTAIVAGFLISALGGSRVQIGGPTGAFVVIVYGIVTKFGYDGLVICTIIAGLILIVLGLARMGALIKFIPYPVITGFTAGIAVIIFSNEIKDFFGLKMGGVPADLMDKWVAYWDARKSVNGTALLVALFTLAILVVWPKISRLVPGPFVAMVAATLLVQFLHLPVETIASRFGGVPSTLPAPHWPSIPWNHMRDYISPSLTVALLAGIESLLSAVVADGMIGTRHKSNMELVAQGVANVGSAVFGGIPATGAIARTATNIRTGGRTPIAGMTHALTLLVILVFLGRWAAMVPLAALAAILVVVAYHMSEWRSFAGLLRAPRGDLVVLLLTFGLTIFIDLTIAVQVGIVVASLMFMKRMSDITNIEEITDQLRDTGEDPGEITQVRKRRKFVGGYEIPAGVEVYAVNGPFFFGAAAKLEDVISEIATPPKVFILRMKNVPVIDATGIYALERMARRCQHQKTDLVLTEIRQQPLDALERAGKLELFGGREHLAKSLDVALDRARQVLGLSAPLEDHKPELAPVRRTEVDVQAPALEAQAAGFARERLELARDLQRRLLPPSTLEADRYRVTARNVPAAYIAGDFYDFIPLGDNRVLLVLADVSDSGVKAGLIMATVKSMVPLLAVEQSNPAPLLGRLNEKLAGQLPKREFVAIALAIYDAERGTLTIANAGLPDPLIVGTARPIAVGGPRYPIGIRKTLSYESVTATLAPRDRVIFFTDGLPEAIVNGEPLGYERLAAEVMRSGGDLEKLFTSLEQLGAGHDDDWTAIVLERGT